MQSLLTQNSLQGDSNAWSNAENVTTDTPSYLISL